MEIELDDTDYRQRQSREEIEYAREYEKWIQSLPDDERRELASLGLDRPSAPGWSSGIGLDVDVSSLAVSEPLAPTDDEQDHDWQTASDLRTAEAIAKLICELLANDPTLGVECIALATGIAYEGSSEVAIAKKYLVTRAAVSKRCLELAERLGVKNVRAMKSESAREIYAERAIAVHRAAGRELTGKTNRASRVQTMGAFASRAAAVWARVKKSQWIKDAGAAELLLARRSLRPCFEIADEIAAMIRAKDNRAIIRELDHDLGGGTGSLLERGAKGAALMTHLEKPCKF